VTPPPIVGLAGYARSGKDSAAAALRSCGYERRAFADPMRDALHRLNPTVRLGGVGWMSLASIVDSYGWEAAKADCEHVRPLLQRIGDLGKHLAGPRVWIDLALADRPELTVVSDVRFPSEAEAIRDAGGVVWRITRPGVGPANDHATEHALDGYPYDAVIPNDGTLADLRARVLGLIPATI
jgi:hypothetical protein